MAITDDEVREAETRMAARQHRTPAVIAAHYDRGRGRVVIRLSTGLEVMFSPHDAQGLESAKPDQLAPIEISPTGHGLHFPKLDADLYVPALLEGLRGSKNWMKAAMERKTATDGRRGGRPRKTAAE
jgi:uncharacterized protein DUF2442